MKKIILTHLFFCILFSLKTNAQSPYELKPKKEALLLGTGITTLGTARYLNGKMNTLTEMEIAALQEEGISGWEEWTTTQGSGTSNTISDVLLYSSQAFPVVMTMLDKKMRKDYLKIGALYSEVFLVNVGFTALVKNTVRRARPFVYDPDESLDKQMSKSARTSFYSGHTSGTAAMCFLTASIYEDYHPNGKWKTVIWTGAATIPAVAGIMRMRAGKHFPSDVITGYVMGAAVGYFLPKIHLKKKKKEDSLSNVRY
ncbi:MAG: phosphatase PAP2 family protein [Bacteroidota bacterium]